MKITNLDIHNFKSIHHMHLQDIENALILVGQNNTGKTTVLDAIRAVGGDYEISPEDLSGMKYLKIQWDKGYCFTYSYEDYYEYEDKGRYERTLKTITVKGNREDFSPTDVQYFTGLTRLELYTGAWENYILPEENVLRCIYCVDGLSKYGTPEFFDRVNPDTLEEVAILDAGELTDFAFMENLKGVKRFPVRKGSDRQWRSFQWF